ncbi:UDP-N-acetylglucosamine 3-dehydrogenase [Candidatus Gugararchaeum adminiculabundum]|nr:UDP-N-acetylglucosamine 3-dehydrogenase [Candidatus Gugararchaeum adminiculabundum]
MDKLKLGVIGVGAMGQHHARVYSEFPDVELVGVSDADAARAEGIASSYRTKFFKDANELLAKVDAVSIAVPTTLHKKLALEAFKKGKSALIEKPIASSLTDADEMIKAAKGVTFMVGHIERFNPAVAELRKIMAKEQIIRLEARRFGPFMPRATNVDVVLDLMIHDIDVARCLFNSEPSKIQAIGGKAFSDKLDYATAIMKFGETDAVLSANRITQKKIRELEVTSKKEFLQLDYLNQTLDINRSSVPEFITQRGNVTYKHQNVVEKIDVPKSEPLKLELRAFVDSVRSGTEPQVSGEEGKKNLQVAFDILKKI